MSDNAMQSHKEAMEFDATMEIIGQVMACYSTKIDREESKEKPNQTLIEHWKKERSKCSSKRHELTREDRQGLARLRTSYGAKVRAMMEEIRLDGK